MSFLRYNYNPKRKYPLIRVFFLLEQYGIMMILLYNDDYVIGGIITMAIYPSKFWSDSSLIPKSCKGVKKMACKKTTTKKPAAKKCGTKEKCKKGGK